MFGKKDKNENVVDPFLDSLPKVVEPPKELLKKVEQPSQYQITLSREEVEGRLIDLGNDQDLNLYLKVLDGERKYKEFLAYKDLIK